jgi:hypothetical protein
MHHHPHHKATDEHEKDPEHVARGLKAAIHNPNVSAEAKDHAAQQLEEMGVKSGAQKLSDEEHIRHQLAGYKATLSSWWLHSSRISHFFELAIYRSKYVC